MKLYLTDKGREILYKAQGGQQLNFSKFVVGDGELGSQAIQTLTNVINPKMNLSISKINVKTDKVVIGTFLTNSALEEGFYFRELGLYANDPDTQEEVLYMYVNAGETAEYIDSKEGDIIEEYLDINVVVSNVSEITATIDESLVYVTDKEFKEHTDAKNKHLTEEEKTAIQDLQPVSEELLNSVDTGVSGIVEADSLVFDVTADMVGKRIECNWNYGLRVNLPSPSEVVEGAMIEIRCHTSRIVEVYSPSGNIFKGNEEVQKCIQPAFTTRRYISKKGINGCVWITNFERKSPNVDLVVAIDPINGSDDEPVYQSDGSTRLFASLSQIELLEEYSTLRIALVGDVTLDKSICISDTYIVMWGNNSSLTIPADYSIRLVGCNLHMHWFTLYVEGTGFYLTGKTHIELGGYEGFAIRPLSNVNFTVFVVFDGNSRTSYKYGSCNLTLTLDNCIVNTDNLEEFSAKGNFLSDTTYYNKSIVFIKFGDNGTMPDTLPSNVYWYNSSNTLSRIGTSTLYTVG